MTAPKTSHFVKGGSRSHLQGLNQLRLLAAFLVFSQHALSSCHADAWIDVMGFRIGRIGTSLFFLLSGFLSATTTRQPLTWMKDRVRVLFPPYWLVTIVGFILAGVTATKTFDGWQVLSQLAGTGYFTHGDHIVNIATWFMSPLLLLYAAATFVRLTSQQYMALVLIAVLIAVAFQIPPEHATLYCHAATFFMAFSVASVGVGFRTQAAGVMAASLLVLTMFQPEFRYGAVGGLLLLAGLQIQREVRWCNWFSGIAYEWFLVHGLCLATVSHLTESSLLICLVGAGLSVAAAILLQRTVRTMIALVRATEQETPASQNGPQRILSIHRIDGTFRKSAKTVSENARHERLPEKAMFVTSNDSSL